MLQVAYPELQKRKMERARHRQWRHEAVRAMQRHVKPMGSMLTEQGVHPARHSTAREAEQVL